jgi:hypothetical protein
MKNIALAIVILILGILALLEFRYTIEIHSPVVAKFDRFTGKLWIVNSGVLSEIENETSTAAVVAAAPAPAEAKK